jgi:alpha-D-glucose phosphate-specific phosphoglucomutase
MWYNIPVIAWKSGCICARGRRETRIVATMKFGTDGWRAIMCDEFTFENVRKVVQAIAEYVKAHKNEHKGIVIGYDARFLSSKFAEAAAEVMMGNGIKVFLPERDIPTPVAAYAVLLQDAAGAVMFTASHNPPEYNGIKYIPYYAGPAEPVITEEIESHLADVAQWAVIPSISMEDGNREKLLEWFDPNPQYVAHIRQIIDVETIRASGLRIAVDPMHGSGRGYFEMILGEAGCDIVTLRNNRDPLFGGGSPEPVEARLGELIETVRNGHADIGLATDGDADRFGIIDRNGKYISPNEVLSLLLVHLIKNRKQMGDVARTVATTHLVDGIAHSYGINVYETPVGFKYIGRLLREKNLVIGGEESGGLSVGTHIPEKDGILAGCLMAELMAVEKQSFSEILDSIMLEVGRYYNRRLDIRYPEEKKEALIERLRTSPPDTVDGRTVVRVLDMDGAKILLDDGSWFLVRPSGTEPLIRVYAEAHDAESLDSILHGVQSLL